MRGFVLTRYGGPETTEMREVPDPPAPAAGQLFVRVRAAGLNPIDIKIRRGLLKPIKRFPLPLVHGNELAGEVEACGEGVAGFAPGDRICVRVDKNDLGAFAERALVRAEHAAKIPAGLTFEAAAGLPLAGLTALQALRDELQVGPGTRVFIPGGAGGVGTFALQIARHLGASEVVTTASPRGAALVRELGATAVVDYTTQRFEDVVRDYDCAFDLLGGESLERTFGVIKRGGTVVSVAGLPEPVTARKDLGRGPGLAALFWLVSFRIRRRAAGHGVRYRFLLMHPSGTELAELVALAGAGKLRIVIDRVFPFDEIAAAIAYLEAGHAKGKVVVAMPAH